LPKTRPNILYIHSHDTGRFIQPYGCAVPTPNLQKLAEEGVLFKQAFCAAPTCSPSRAALLTGQSAHSAGMLGLAHRGCSMNDYDQHIVHTLRASGYCTALAGIQHITTEREKIGYDIHLGKEADAEIKAAEFLKNAPQQPLFLSVGFWETHREYPNDNLNVDPRYVQPPSILPDTIETRLDMAAFLTSVRVLDSKIGIVLNALKQSGLMENTLVICTTDHGIAFPNMKCNLTDDGIGAMLIMKGPGGFTGGKVFDAMVSHIDIFPTICELLGVENPEWLQGKSIMPLIRGTTESINKQIFAEVNYHVGYEPQRAVRTTRYKYIRRFGEFKKRILSNVDDGSTKEVLLKNGWAQQSQASEQLYDLVLDPCEKGNLIDEPTHADVADDMRNRLLQWMKSTDDPLLFRKSKRPQTPS
jgi:N-sulfoglucosamine sulfohydrolase